MQPKQLIPEGTYLAKITGGGISCDNAKGEMQVGVKFGLKTGGTIWYYGDLMGPRAQYEVKPGLTVQQITFENLAKLGLNDSKVMDDFGAAANSSFDTSYFLNPEKEFELVITTWEKNGKSGNQVRYINEAGGGKFAKSAPVEVKAALASINFAAEMAAARAKLGIMPVQAGPSIGFDKNESVPF